MNEVNARARQTPIGWVGELRKVHRADYELVAENGIPITFATEHEAEIAAWRALRSHLQGQIVGSGDKAAAGLTEAEAKFGKLLRGGGKTVAVERR
ncbi:hypothetical protein NKG99_03930 [Mesorhizobium sp. M1409]|uniref:hypothetical protein n=1 Tax=Mesorhizobium sp. M1409 TaxID=2957100 RepID=UPI0033355DCA